MCTWKQLSDPAATVEERLKVGELTIEDDYYDYAVDAVDRCRRANAIQQLPDDDDTDWHLGDLLSHCQCMLLLIMDTG